MSYAGRSVASASAGPTGREASRPRCRREAAHRFLRRIARCLICRGLDGIRAAILVLLAAGTAAAAVPADDAGEPPAELPAAPSLLERYNRVIFSMNGFIYRQVDRIGPKSDGPKSDPVTSELSAGAIAGGNFGNVVSNLVNEPLSATASAIIGDLAGVKRAVKRFSINSTAGVFGYYDRATALGLPAEQRDLGLALCARGVPAGPYIMLGFIGPRTLRDAVMDVMVVNLVMYSAAAAVFGAGGGLATVVAVESVEVVLDIVATRQIDTKAKALESSDFGAMRDHYLQQRTERCAALVEVMQR
jgi:phospholipid-binding lipoprotein MlaA